MRISGVGRDADIREGLDSFEAVQVFSDEHEVGMQSRDGFEAGIDSAADLGFQLRLPREITIVRVSDQAVLQAESVDGLGQIGREGDNALDVLRDADGTADFVGDLAIGGRHLHSWWCFWRSTNCGAGTQQDERGCRSSFLRRVNEHSQHESPSPRAPPTKKPHASSAGAQWWRLFSRKAQSPRHGRVAWLTALQPITVAGPRPIHTAYPASLACKIKRRVYAGAAR